MKRFILLIGIFFPLQSMELPNLADVLAALKNNQIFISAYENFPEHVEQYFLNYSQWLDIADRIKFIHQLTSYQQTIGSLTREKCMSTAQAVENCMCSDFINKYFSNIKDDEETLQQYKKLFEDYENQRSISSHLGIALGKVLLMVKNLSFRILDKPHPGKNTIAASCVEIQTEYPQFDKTLPLQDTVLLTENLKKCSTAKKNIQADQMVLKRKIDEYSNDPRTQTAAPELLYSLNIYEGESILGYTVNSEYTDIVRSLYDQLKEKKNQEQQCDVSLQEIIRLLNQKIEKALYDERDLERQQQKKNKEYDILMDKHKKLLADLKKIEQEKKSLEEQSNQLQFHQERAHKARIEVGKMLLDKNLKEGVFEANIQKFSTALTKPHNNF